MKTASTLRIILALTLIFAIGAVAGASLSRGTIRHQQATATAAGSHDLVDRFLAQKQSAYVARLRLSAEQVEQLRPALDKTRADLRASHERTTREVWRIMGEHYQALNRLLTAEQQVVFRQMVEERRLEALKTP
jgi:hypothetical protein